MPVRLWNARPRPCSLHSLNTPIRLDYLAPFRTSTHVRAGSHRSMGRCPSRTSAATAVRSRRVALLPSNSVGAKHPLAVRLPMTTMSRVGAHLSLKVWLWPASISRRVRCELYSFANAFTGCRGLTGGSRADPARARSDQTLFDQKIGCVGPADFAGRRRGGSF